MRVARFHRIKANFLNSNPSAAVPQFGPRHLQCKTLGVHELFPPRSLPRAPSLSLSVCLSHTRGPCEHATIQLCPRQLQSKTPTQQGTRRPSAFDLNHRHAPSPASRAPARLPFRDAASHTPPPPCSLVPVPPARLGSCLLQDPFRLTRSPPCSPGSVLSAPSLTALVLCSTDVTFSNCSHGSNCYVCFLPHQKGP